jgi:predicted DNA-binding ArsR family transcriptional regulator
MKKQQLIRQIYHLHILLANTWGNTWLYIQQTIGEKPKKLIQLKYKSLDKNLNRVVQEQTKTPKQIHTFYTTVVNNTNITVTNNEIKLLEKGPKCNLHSQKKNWLTTLALEAQTTITYFFPKFLWRQSLSNVTHSTGTEYETVYKWTLPAW